MPHDDSRSAGVGLGIPTAMFCTVTRPMLSSLTQYPGFTDHRARAGRLFGGWGGEGGRGFGAQKTMYQKWPSKISPIVNFVFSRDGLGRGGGGFGGGGPRLGF